MPVDCPQITQITRISFSTAQFFGKTLCMKPGNFSGDNFSKPSMLLLFNLCNLCNLWAVPVFFSSPAGNNHPYNIRHSFPGQHMHALEVNNLRKTYANGVEALKGISLNIEEGDFFAFLGPNGAGKSTLIGIISSLVNSSSGEVKIFGTSVQQQRSKAMSYIGLVPQELNFNQFEKPLEIIVNQAGYYEKKKKTALQRAEK